MNHTPFFGDRLDIHLPVIFMSTTGSQGFVPQPNPDDTLKLFPTHSLKLFKLFGARNQSDPSRKVRTNTCLFETTHISQLAKQWMNMDVFRRANF